MTEENGATPEPPQGQVAINTTQQGMSILIQPPAINLTVDEASMNQMVTDWLGNHPALFEALIKARLATKQAELKLIQNIRETKLN